MGASAVIAGGSMAAGLFGSYMESEGIKAEADYQSRMANLNAKLIEVQAEDTMIQAATDESNLKSKARQMKGAQRAALAAQGVVVDSGSAADIQLETDEMAAYDAMTIRNNAIREAHGLKLQAQNLRSEARAKKRAARSRANMTLLGGGLNAAKSFSAMEFGPSRSTTAIGSGSGGSMAGQSYLSTRNIS